MRLARRIPRRRPDNRQRMYHHTQAHLTCLYPLSPVISLGHLLHSASTFYFRTRTDVFELPPRARLRRCYAVTVSHSPAPRRTLHSPLHTKPSSVANGCLAVATSKHLSVSSAPLACTVGTRSAPMSQRAMQTGDVCSNPSMLSSWRRPPSSLCARPCQWIAANLIAVDRQCHRVLRPSQHQLQARRGPASCHPRSS